VINKLTVDERRALATLFKSINWHDPVERHAIATKIVEMVVSDVYQQDVINRLADVERFGPGEELQFHVLDEVLAYVIEPGGYLPRSTMTKTSVTLPRHRVGVSVELDIDQLSSGRYGTVNDIRRKIGEALLGARNGLVWDTLFASVVSGDSNYATFSSSASADTKKTALDTAISYVHDNTNNGPIAIAGRWSALDWIEQIDGSKWFSDNARDAVLNDGFLGVYKGVPIVRMRSYKDRNAVQKINANHIMVISDGTIKFGEVEPGTRVLDEIKGDTLGWNLNIWESYGTVVVQPERNYHLEIV